MSKISKKGFSVLHDPLQNKGTAFTEKERQTLGLEGLLPPRVDSLELQLGRVHAELDMLDSDLQRYLFLMDLQSRNQTLFFAILMSDPARFMPLVYTPTVGEACQKFDHIFRSTRGIYLPISAKGRLKDILKNWPQKDVRFIVVTDGERILGLGDLGVNGMGIPIGKLALYTAVAGVPPELTLPITLDVGTNNEEYRNDPLYLGLQQPRVRGKAYDDFIEEFVEAVQTLYPKCCLQWEDFANINAVPILAKYKDKICTYNDDIQGTAGIALAGIYGALRISGQKLVDQRFLFMGAGSAATGIAELISLAMVSEGLTIEEARARNTLFDVNGLITSSRKDLADFQKPFAQKIKPCSSIEAMSTINERPIIFPYSNPTSRSECTAEEAYKWSKGNAIFASGSPFEPVTLLGKTFIPGQGNNVYIFPAMGMAVLATQASRVTEEMFIVAAKAVADQVTQDELDSGLIYPPQSQILNASLRTATKIAEYIFEQGLARVKKPKDIEAHIHKMAYKPVYEK
jgi:malate dehydrogenase (oxaloacetate-decarboxylating)(NADP+)